MKKPMVFEGIIAILIILLLFAAYLMVSGSGSNGGGVNSTTMVSSIYPGKDGMIYAFAGNNGNTIYALDSKGDLKWTVQVPDTWSVYNQFEYKAYDFRAGTYNDSGTGPQNSYIERDSPIFSDDNGYLYICVAENITASVSGDPYAFVVTEPEESLMAISPQGSILWNKNLSRMPTPFESPLPDIGLYANNGSIYLFSEYYDQNDSGPQYHNELQVFNRDGSIRFILKNLSMMPAIGDNGYIYAVPLSSDNQNPSTVEAYYPNGTLYWQRNISMPIEYGLFGPGSTEQFSSLPLYSNHTLYVPISNGIWALDMNGSVKWFNNFNDGDAYLLDSMPVDDAGNVYFECYPIEAQPYIDIITSSGNNIVRQMSGYNQISGDPETGILYGASFSINNLTSGTISLADLATVNLSAYDPVNDSYLWNQTFSPDPTDFVISQDTLSSEISPGTDLMMSSTESQYIWNVKLLPWDSYNMSTEQDPYYTAVNITPPKDSNFELGLKVQPENGTTFINYYAANYVNPDYSTANYVNPSSSSDSLNGSNCVYSNVLYAIDKNGTVIWQRPLGSYLTSMVSSNGTIFFSTGDGKLGMAVINGAVAGGVTLLALAFVFIRFFLAGFVVRARDRLDKNENRIWALKFIAENPGSTLREISRGSGINLGTVRYHVFILNMNHRIVSYMADDKHVRYFTNAGSYSKEEQFVISLMRREGVRKILELLNEKPGLTNLELSSALGLQESAVSRYMKELAEKGVVARDSVPDGRFAYSIKNDYRKAISMASGLHGHT